LRIVFLTTSDPLYLPAFFDRVLERWTKETAAVYVVPPLYENQTATAAAWRYCRTFGLAASFALARRVLASAFRRRSIAASCARHGVACAKTRDVNAADFLGELALLRPDVVVSVSCPQIFGRDLISLPPQGVVNVHGAPLPEYRGVMPSFWMLANGEPSAGVSIHFVDEQLDAGPLCGQRTFPILADETLDVFLRRSKAIAAELLTEVLERIERGTVERRAMDLTKGSYYSWPDRTAVGRFAAAGRRLW
jgi:methionyl-tRNA formyltransferase